MLPPAGPVAVLRSAYRVPAFCWMLPSWSRPKFGQLGGQIGTLRQVAESLNAAFIPWRIQKDVAEIFGNSHHVVARCDDSTIVPFAICDELPASEFRTPDRQLATNCRGQEPPPHPLPCLYRSARRFYLPPSRIAGSDLPGRPDLAPGWYPCGRPAVAGGRPAAVQYCVRVQLWNNLAAQF